MTTPMEVAGGCARFADGEKLTILTLDDAYQPSITIAAPGTRDSEDFAKEMLD